jgi:hypothetical protein
MKLLKILTTQKLCYLCLVIFILHIMVFLANIFLDIDKCVVFLCCGVLLGLLACQLWFMFKTGKEVNLIIKHNVINNRRKILSLRHDIY